MATVVTAHRRPSRPRKQGASMGRVGQGGAAWCHWEGYGRRRSSVVGLHACERRWVTNAKRRHNGDPPTCTAGSSCGTCESQWSPIQPRPRLTATAMSAESPWCAPAVATTSPTAGNSIGPLVCTCAGACAFNSTVHSCSSTCDKAASSRWPGTLPSQVVPGGLRSPERRSPQTRRLTARHAASPHTPPGCHRNTGSAHERVSAGVGTGSGCAWTGNEEAHTPPRRQPSPPTPPPYLFPPPPPTQSLHLRRRIQGGKGFKLGS